MLLFCIAAVKSPAAAWWHFSVALQILGSMASGCAIFLPQQCSLYVTRFGRIPLKNSMACGVTNCDVVVLKPKCKCPVHSKCSEREVKWDVCRCWTGNRESRTTQRKSSVFVNLLMFMKRGNRSWKRFTSILQYQHYQTSRNQATTGSEWANLLQFLAVCDIQKPLAFGPSCCVSVDIAVCISISKLEVCYGFWKSFSGFDEAAVLVSDLSSSKIVSLLRGLEQTIGHIFGGEGLWPLFPLFQQICTDFIFLTDTFYINLSLKSNTVFCFLLCFTFLACVGRSR